MWYHQEPKRADCTWVLYSDATMICAFSHRTDLVRFCADMNFPVRWRPHWAAPDGAKIVGSPTRNPHEVR
jgi:hypothetical protein